MPQNTPSYCALTMAEGGAGGAASQQSFGKPCHPGRVCAIAMHDDRRWSAGGMTSDSTLLEWSEDGHATAQINCTAAGAC